MFKNSYRNFHSLYVDGEWSDLCQCFPPLWDLMWITCVCFCICVSVAFWCPFLVVACSCSKKAFITLCSPVVPLLSTSKADSGLASEFRRDRAIYTAYERMLKYKGRSEPHQSIATVPHYLINSRRAQFDSSVLITFAILIRYCSSFQAWESLYARRWSSGQIMQIQRGKKVTETLFFPLKTWIFL